MTIRVLLADEQTLTRLGLRAVLRPKRGIEVVGDAKSGSEAVEKAVALCPDVVLMDPVMPDEDGIAAIRAIKQRCPGTEILILTADADPGLFRKAVAAGAVGYVLKDISPTNLIDAISAVHAGETVINPFVARQIIENFFGSGGRPSASPAGQRYGITPRGLDVLMGVMQGLSDKEIASKLFLSESTVKTHLRTIYQRLKLRNRAQAAAFVVERNLLPRRR